MPSFLPGVGVQKPKDKGGSSEQQQTRKVCAMPVGSPMNHHTPVEGMVSTHLGLGLRGQKRPGD